MLFGVFFQLFQGVFIKLQIETPFHALHIVQSSAGRSGLLLKRLSDSQQGKGEGGEDTKKFEGGVTEAAVAPYGPAEPSVGFSVNVLQQPEVSLRTRTMQNPLEHP